MVCRLHSDTFLQEYHLMYKINKNNTYCDAFFCRIYWQNLTGGYDIDKNLLCKMYRNMEDRNEKNIYGEMKN